LNLSACKVGHGMPGYDIDMLVGFDWRLILILRGVPADSLRRLDSVG